MVGILGNILPPSLKAQLFSIQRTQRAMDSAQLQLATGKKVNSALDNPDNFFTSRALQTRAGDLGRLLDGLGQGIRTLQTTENGIQAAQDLIEQMDALAAQARDELEAGSAKGTLDEVILAADPAAYWRLNEPTGNVAENLGSLTGVNGVYSGGGGGPIQGETELFYDGNASAYFDGQNDRVNIPSNVGINTDVNRYPERTVELIFDADRLSGRQVLYEEGGTTNAFSIYLDDDMLHVVGRDAGAWGPPDISMQIEAGKSYHVAFSFDFPNREFTGYVNGENIGSVAVNATFPRHTAQVAIGYKRGGTHYHDGASGGNSDYFQGHISNVALYNDALTDSDIQDRYDASQLGTSQRYQDEYNALLSQLDQLVHDTDYRGINLLERDNLSLALNESRSNFLTVDGTDFTASKLGITHNDFRTANDVNEITENILESVIQTRSFARSIANDLNIIKTRRNFTESTINTLESGADDLTLTDQNEVGAEFLALQVRQEVQFATLGFSRQAASILDVLS